MGKKILITAATCILFIAACIAIFFLKDKKVVIKFDSDGGRAVESIEIKKGGKVTLPTTTKDGYVFNGWYLENTKVSDETTYDKDTTLKANWLKEDAKTFTVTFDSDGGSKVESITVESGKELSLPANPTKKGYTFLSWVDRNETPIYDKALLSCDDITLRANWMKEETKTNKNSKTENNTEKPETTKTYSCPEGYTLNGTKCTMEKDPTKGCNKQTHGKYNGKCYAISSYKAPACKVYTGNTSAHSGQPNLVDGKVISSGSTIYCVAESMQLSGCASNGGTVINGSSCYKYVQTTTAENVCSSYSGYEYIIGNALYDTSVGRTNVSTGCYKGEALQDLCESDYTLTNGKCVKTIEATLK